MKFGSLDAFAAHLRHLAAAEDEAIERGVRAAADLVQAEVRSEFGEYQGVVGPFGAWPKLAEATQADRVRQGYPADAPLLRSGSLRDSVEVSASGPEALVGSDDPRARAHELGNERVPPRSFLGAGTLRAADDAVEAMVAPIERLIRTGR